MQLKLAVFALVNKTTLFWIPVLIPFVKMWTQKKEGIYLLQKFQIWIIKSDY